MPPTSDGRSRRWSASASVRGGELGIVQRWSLEEPAGSPRTNTYVVVAGSLALRNHLGVREVLRADPVVRDEYATLKLAIARATADTEQYVEAKSVLLSTILKRAGLTDHERQLIEQANRAG